MKFSVIPVVDKMIELYEKPRNRKRFEEYIEMLRDGKGGDMKMPIVAYNPMAKEHVLEKLKALKGLDVEGILERVCEEIQAKGDGEFRVAIALADDLKGGWTNRYSADYDTRFKLDAMLKRGFCNVIFWSSEEYNAEMVEQVCLEYLWNTVYQTEYGQPVSLEEHVAQMRFVNEKLGLAFEVDEEIYEQYKDSKDYPVIFAFIYGDKAAKEFGYQALGVGVNLHKRNGQKVDG